MDPHGSLPRATSSPRASSPSAEPGHNVAPVAVADQWVGDVRRLVARGTRRLVLQPCDREEIIADAVVRVHDALSRKRPGRGRELRAILAMNAKWAIDDFCREISRRADHETLTEPLSIPDTPVPAAQACIERRAWLEEVLETLNERERAVVIEHDLLDYDCREIAARHRMRHDAARKAYSRAAQKVRMALKTAA